MIKALNLTKKQMLLIIAPVKILTWSAPMLRLNLSSSAASDCAKPSSPICPKTNDSHLIPDDYHRIIYTKRHLIKSRSAASAIDSASLFPQLRTCTPAVTVGNCVLICWEIDAQMRFFAGKFEIRRLNAVEPFQLRRLLPDCDVPAFGKGRHACSQL